MNVVLWILQAVLALAYTGAAVTKLTQPKEKLASTMAWVNDYSGPGVKAIGGLELLGALGLILPWATGIARVLTPIAGLGLAVIMVGAMVTHGRRREFPMIWVNAVLAALTLIVVIGRFADL